MSLEFLFLDMNSYFASVEQQMRPALRGRPVVITPVMADSGCCIAASYEAKRLGIKTGMRVLEARRLCRGVHVVEARAELYVEVHHRIVAAVESCAHVDRVMSVDEMACRLYGEHRLRAGALRLADDVKQAIRGKVGESLCCSVGLGPNCFLAKVASDMQKPDGLTVIEPSDLPDALHTLELTDLPGIGDRMMARLNGCGIHTVKQLCALSEEQLWRAWGSVVGRVWWHHLRGHQIPCPPERRQSVGHSHVLPPNLRNDTDAYAVLVKLIHRAAARMRSLGHWARQMSVYVSYYDRREWRARVALGLCRDTLTMVEALRKVWPDRPHGLTPSQVGMTLYDLVSNRDATIPLFEAERCRVKLADAMDQINARYGNRAVQLGVIHHIPDTAPTRIPFTHIPDYSLRT